MTPAMGINYVEMSNALTVAFQSAWSYFWSLHFAATAAVIFAFAMMEGGIDSGLGSQRNRRANQPKADGTQLSPVATTGRPAPCQNPPLLGSGLSHGVPYLPPTSG